MSKVVSLQRLEVRSFTRPGTLMGLALAWSMACGREEPEPDSRPQSEESGQTRPLLTNGSFESGPLVGEGGQFVTLFAGSGELPGWSISGGGIDYVFSMWRGAEGSRSIDLSALSEGSISQTLDNLKPGVAYTVHFWMAGNGDCSPPAKQLRVEADDQKEDFTFDTTGRTALQMGWTRYNFTFRPKTPSPLLTFRSMTGSRCGPALDDIELSAP